METPPGRIAPWGRWFPFLGDRAAPTVAVAAGVATGTGAAGDAGPELGFTHVTITCDYDLADGQSPTGTVYFTPSDWLRNNGVTIPAAEVSVTLDVDGRISAHLAANTNPATTPTGSYYTVREEIVGQPTRSYRVTIPHAQGSPLNLQAL